MHPNESSVITPVNLNKRLVFTWYEATIEMDGITETDYTADEVCLFFCPRVIVVGPVDSEKSTLSRMLLSWSAKQGWKPTFVDLDIGQGSITIPGCIAATPIEMPIDPMDGIPLEMPLVYFYGHTTPRQFSGNAKSRAAGMVINTMGWIEGVGYELILHAIDTFNANVVLVTGQEKLCSMLKDVLKNKLNVDVVKLQKSGGVVSRGAKFRQKARSYRIREYFYGLANDLAPYSNVSNFSDLFVYRIGSGPQAPRSALPIVNINRDMLHLVLVVSFVKEPDQIHNNVIDRIGLVYVKTEIELSHLVSHCYLHRIMKLSSFFVVGY
ncbi:hypothetical protein PVL29_018543 [Vitis rotundifolia]|uniref:Clp1 P-loop domain-containing protein n=1 Tax=Vitis rotundifolia TaxID=103349 RepID=A0AA38Z594_VITRO|nr:hypothetical protein PVL29_018543 [Vitis rotundifolia]